MAHPWPCAENATFPRSSVLRAVGVWKAGLGSAAERRGGNHVVPVHSVSGLATLGQKSSAYMMREMLPRLSLRRDQTSATTMTEPRLPLPKAHTQQSTGGECNSSMDPVQLMIVQIGAQAQKRSNGRPSVARAAEPGGDFSSFFSTSAPARAADRGAAEGLGGDAQNVAAARAAKGDGAARRSGTMSALACGERSSSGQQRVHQQRSPPGRARARDSALYAKKALDSRTPLRRLAEEEVAPGRAAAALRHLRQAEVVPRRRARAVAVALDRSADPVALQPPALRGPASDRSKLAFANNKGQGACLHLGCRAPRAVRGGWRERSVYGVTGAGSGARPRKKTGRRRAGGAPARGQRTSPWILVGPSRRGTRVLAPQQRRTQGDAARTGHALRQRRVGREPPVGAPLRHGASAPHTHSFCVMAKGPSIIAYQDAGGFPWWMDPNTTVYDPVTLEAARPAAGARRWAWAEAGRRPCEFARAQVALAPGEWCADRAGSRNTAVLQACPCARVACVRRCCGASTLFHAEMGATKIQAKCVPRAGAPPARAAPVFFRGRAPDPAPVTYTDLSSHHPDCDAALYAKQLLRSDGGASQRWWLQRNGSALVEGYGHGRAFAAHHFCLAEVAQGGGRPPRRDLFFCQARRCVRIECFLRWPLAGAHLQCPCLTHVGRRVDLVPCSWRRYMEHVHAC
ncbi:Protein of unknown function [Gryllus bimaculatus]|nr:Protein of unknown function [Gryllus bimaculatus]